MVTFDLEIQSVVCILHYLKRMKRIVVAILLTVSFSSAHAGWDLLFCTNTDSLGNCKGKGEAFAWTGERTPINLIVMNKDGLGLEKLRFMIFNMKNDREGKLYASLSQNVRPKALYTVKDLLFYAPGYYRVDVLDNNNNQLSSGFITVTDREIPKAISEFQLQNSEK